MPILLPPETVQVDFEQCILQAWHEAHGVDSGRITSSWGKDRVVVMIEDAFFRGERLLTQSEQGREVVEQYVQKLMAYVVENQRQTLSKLLQREIDSTSISVNSEEQWVMFVFRLVE